MILYEMVTQKRLYSGDHKTLESILREAPQSPRSLNREIPEQLSAICVKCLSKDPRDRFASARQLSDELERFLHASVASSPSPASPPGDLANVLAEREQLTAQNHDLHRRVRHLTRLLIALTADHNLYQSLVQSLPIGVFRKNLEKQFVFANDHFCRTAGRGIDEVKGKTAREVFPKDLASQQEVDDAKVIATDEVLRTAEATSADGEETTFEVVRSPVHNFDGEIVGVQGLMWDVSAHTRAENALRHAKELAEATSQAKSDFLANMSHEIRTPMASILGMADLLSDTDIDSIQQTYVSAIEQAGDSLLYIINDVLDFAKIEAGRMDLKHAVFDLRSDLSRVKAILAERALRKNLELEIAVDDDVPEFLIGDSNRLKQVMFNLVGNAIKFTGEGSVDARVDVDSFTGDQVRLRFEIADTGVGIPENKLTSIFDAFEQADTSTSRSFGGTGLGLTISSKIVCLMGGEIAVESRVGVGSVFRFTADFHKATDEEIEKWQSVNRSTRRNTPHAAQPLNILVVDDLPTNQLVVEHKLQRLGHEVTLAASGAEALLHLQDREFDVILMDVQMAEVDGLELTRMIRKEEESSSSHVPIIALTAHAMKGDRERCLEAGMDGYVSKPIDWDQLSVTMASVVDTEVPRSSGELFVAHELLKRVDGDTAFLERLIRSFLDVYPELLAHVREAVASHDVSALQESSHRLKGALANLLGEGRIDAVSKLESMARQGQLLDADGQCRELTFEMERLRDQLRAHLEEISR